MENLKDLFETRKTVQVTKGKYAWCYGSLISINDNTALVEIDDVTTISCELEDIDILTE